MNFITKNVTRIAAFAAVLLAAQPTLSYGMGGKPVAVNTKIAGVTGPTVEVLNGKLSISMIFENIYMEGGVTIPLPKYANSSVYIGPDFTSAGTLMQVTVSVGDYLANKGQGLDPQTLPGGRPLPTIAAGQLPAIALVIPQLKNAVFYFGPQVIGLFVPISINTGGLIVSSRFYDKNGKNIGILALVGNDAAGKNGGFLALMDATLLGILKGSSIL